MIEYLCTSDFIRSINNLTRKPKYQYNSCIKDIKDELKEKNITQIIDSAFLLYQNMELHVLKIRIKKSEQRVGKSGGYRLIAAANNKTNRIAFLQIYPKTGRFKKEDFDKDDELDKHLETLQKEIETNSIMKFNLSDVELGDFI